MSRPFFRRAFTLIELMVVVAVMAVLLTISIPTLYRNMHQDSMRKAVNDVLEICTTARAEAILSGTPMDLRIRPADRVLSVGAAASARPSNAPETGLPARPDYQWGDRMIEPRPAAPAPANSTITLSISILIEGLGVNGEDWTEDEEARVRFFPNGTCDEMSIVLLSDKGERRNIWLEVVTGLAEVETDIFKFRAR